MRKLITLTSALMLVSVSHAQWVEKSASPAMGLTQLNVLNNDTLFLTDNMAYILKSTNSGADWDTIPFINASDFKIQFINDSVGFIGGLAAFITGPTYFKTEDCGITWQPMNFYAGGGLYFHTVCFINKDTGFVSNGMDLAKTIDGGDTFATSYLMSPAHNITAITFVNEQVGFAAARIVIANQLYGNILFKTTDQGNSWTEVYNDTSANNGQFVYPGISQIYFIDEQNGYSVGPPGYLLHTTDGGASWDRLPSPDENGISAIDFVDLDTGYAVVYPNLYKTTDRGLSWQVLTVPSGTDVMDVEFVNSDIGYISGHKVCKTTSGTIGIEPSVLKSKFKIYPNPAKNNIRLQYDDLHIQSLQLIDLFGRVTRTFKPESKTLNVSGLSAGIYFLKANAWEGAVTEKVMVE